LETIGRDLNEMQRVPLAESHVAALRAAGSVALYPAGTFIVQPGDPADRFIYVEDGEIEVVNSFSGERHVPSTLGPSQFMAEISLLNGGVWSMPMRAVSDTRVIEVPRVGMLTLMSQIPEMSDIIITVLAARRRRQLDTGFGTLVLIGEEADRDVRRIGDFVSRNRLPHSSYAQYGYGVPVSRDQLQPGDLVFFDGLGHVGIYIGGDQFVHAPHTGDVVKISSLSEGWYTSTYVGARRIL